MQVPRKSPAAFGPAPLLRLPVAVALLITGLGAPGVHQASAAGALPIASVESSSGTGERTYGLAVDDCAFRLVAYTTELNRGVVKCSTRCTLPLSGQIPHLRRILEEFLGKDPDAPSFRTLFWGGLVPESGPSSLELSQRLALAAHRSPGWDARRGRPKTGDANRFVKDLANSELIYPELSELFAGTGRSLSIASVEKVRVLEARELPFHDELRKAGVEATEKLPFDCMVWFSVSAATGGQRR